MIITGYQGIGKSSVAKDDPWIVDLESTNFWKYEETEPGRLTGEKSRPDDWYIYYCQVAQDLSRQGYTVFVSCHPQVRKWLAFHNTERFCAVFPSEKLKEKWLERLFNRYRESGLEKDKRAFDHAKDHYSIDIDHLLYECQYGEEYYHSAYIIDDLENYDLKKVIGILRERADKNYGMKS